MVRSASAAGDEVSRFRFGRLAIVAAGFFLFLLVLVCLLSGGSGRPSYFDKKPLRATRAEVQAAPIPLLASRRHG